MEISKCKLRQVSGLSHRFALRPSPPTNLGSFSDFVTSTFIPWLFNETVRLVPYSPSQSAHHWLLQLILSTSFQTFSKSSKHILHPLMLLPLWPLFFWDWGTTVPSHLSASRPLPLLHSVLTLHAEWAFYKSKSDLVTILLKILHWLFSHCMWENMQIPSLGAHKQVLAWPALLARLCCRHTGFLSVLICLQALCGPRALASSAGTTMSLVLSTLRDFAEVLVPQRSPPWSSKQVSPSFKW